jgi:hypothetical protein
MCHLFLQKSIYHLKYINKFNQKVSEPQFMYYQKSMSLLLGALNKKQLICFSLNRHDRQTSICQKLGFHLL